MQIKNDPSSNPYAHDELEQESVGESELHPAVKTGSLIALIAVILGTLLGSLLATPDPTEIAEQDDNEVITATEFSSEPEIIESETTAVTPPVTTSVSPTTDVAPITTAPITSTDSTEIDTTTAPITQTDEIEVDETLPEDAIRLNSGLNYSQTTELEPVAPIGGFPDEPVETPEATTPETPVVSEGVDPATTPETLTTTGSSLPDIETTTPETTTSVDPSALDTTTPQVATATALDPAQLEQLSQTVYQTIDQAWTTTPVTGESVYRVKVDQNGSIIGFEPKSSVATQNVDNTPLPELASSQGVTTAPSFAEFDVIFQPDGLLQLNPAE
ncbi:MAG: hypothetical protein WBA13_13590 [Microcoleaceae cyanobacterium]